MATWRILLIALLGILVLAQAYSLLMDLGADNFSSYEIGFITGKLLLILIAGLIIRLIYLKGRQQNL